MGKPSTTDSSGMDIQDDYQGESGSGLAQSGSAILPESADPAASPSTDTVVSQPAASTEPAVRHSARQRKTPKKFEDYVLSFPHIPIEDTKKSKYTENVDVPSGSKGKNNCTLNIKVHDYNYADSLDSEELHSPPPQKRRRREKEDLFFLSNLDESTVKLLLDLQSDSDEGEEDAETVVLIPSGRNTPVEVPVIDVSGHMSPLPEDLQNASPLLSQPSNSSSAEIPAQPPRPLTEPDGLIHRFLIYAGAADPDVSGEGHASKVVHKLMTALLGEGRAIYMDNFYNSVELASSLLDQQTYVTGTLRPNRKNNPRDLAACKLKRGESTQRWSQQGINVTKWKDKREVWTISSEVSGDMVTVSARQMPRSENGVKRPPVDKQKLELAVNEVLKGMSINECSKIHNIGRWTISRHLTNFKEQNSENFEYKNNCGHRKVFTDDEEKDLVNYLLLASRIYFGITKRGLSTLAFEFARQNGKHFPKTWHDNAKAGKQWVQDFLILELGMKPVFSPAQEKELVDHILIMEARMFGLSIADVRRLAYQLAEANEINHNFNEEKKCGKALDGQFQKEAPTDFTAHSGANIISSSDGVQPCIDIVAVPHVVRLQVTRKRGNTAILAESPYKRALEDGEREKKQKLKAKEERQLLRGKGGKAKWRAPKQDKTAPKAGKAKRALNYDQPSTSKADEDSDSPSESEDSCIVCHGNIFETGVAKCNMCKATVHEACSGLVEDDLDLISAKCALI
ncbi:hypothetical protein GE061_000885 [Apolygus lucorum]|uniref:PiggyBac transposable element-derived protein domain-containing protein n=1 Tax=Apolygus lucorum TaxID=248454 RepID=A0A8S9Y5I4_APOLU|nr:hypothetical protein GE061_000885 [Apolygus lucorum]